MFQRVRQEFGTDVALLVFPQSYHPRTFVILCIFYRDAGSRRRTKPFARTFKRLVEVAAEHGWGEYRTHTAFKDECGPCTRSTITRCQLHEKIKDASIRTACCPAGRYGIWPKHLRDP